MLRERGSTGGEVQVNRYTKTIATIKSPRTAQQRQEVGIVLHGRGRNRRRNDVAEDVP
jgi:hypothetical protein